MSIPLYSFITSSRENEQIICKKFIISKSHGMEVNHREKSRNSQKINKRFVEKIQHIRVNNDGKKVHHREKKLQFWLKPEK